jgi:ribosomal protein L33
MREIEIHSVCPYCRTYADHKVVSSPYRDQIVLRCEECGEKFYKAEKDVVYNGTSFELKNKPKKSILQIIVETYRRIKKWWKEWV